VANAGEENIATVHEPKAQTSRRNALRTESPCYEAFPRSTNPVVEGTYAIKVSIVFFCCLCRPFNGFDVTHGPDLASIPVFPRSRSFHVGPHFSDNRYLSPQPCSQCHRTHRRVEAYCQLFPVSTLFSEHIGQKKVHFGSGYSHSLSDAAKYSIVADTLIPD